MNLRRNTLVAAIIVIIAHFFVSGDRAAFAEDALARRGYELLRTAAYLPSDFDQQVFDELWKTWEPPLRAEAATATVAERRAMAYRRYGLIADDSADSAGGVLQYITATDGKWTMNCLACHQGELNGRVIPGLPNVQYELATLTEEVRATKLRMQKPLGRMDKGSLFVPLGNSRGTTNAVMFGVVLMHYRDSELNVHPDRPRPAMVHHDLDAPPWWHFKKKTHLYYDGFAPKSHRALMQFLLVPQNGPERFREWEDDYRAVDAYLESLEPPRYPFEIDSELAARGETVFNRHCAKCHGTYGENETYPGKVVPIDVVKTDRVRLDALTVEHRRSYGASWFAANDREPVIDDPGGYIAPPLDGIWASAPYLHNGSVPTLWHLMHADERPVVWRRVGDEFDSETVGFAITAHDELPAAARSLHERRQFFDNRQFGKSAAGHLFPERLTEDEKQALIEYLKTL